MPVSTDQVTIQYRILPLTIQPDYSMQVNVRKGLWNGMDFTEIDSKTVTFQVAETEAILSAVPPANTTRRADLTSLLYQALMAAGHIPLGTVS